MTLSVLRLSIMKPKNKIKEKENKDKEK